jgi:hypothetical protein
MTKEFHIEMIDNIEDYTKRFTIVRGMCDIVEKKLGVFSSPGSNYVVTNNDYWIVLGNLNDEAIKEVFGDSYFGDDGVTREGCYEYKACIYYESGTWNEPGELYIDYIDFVFVESFESRMREQKLQALLGDDLFPL